MTDATTNKPVWAPSTRKLYRAAMYWGFGKRAAWTLASAAHKRMVDRPWVTWTGGDCPVPFRTFVDVRYRGGLENHGVPALVGAATDWSHTANPRDIVANPRDLVAYRVCEDALDHVSHNDLAGIDKPFVNGAALPLAAREQVPALFDLEEVDHDVVTRADPQVDAIAVFVTLEELYSCGLRRKRTKDGGWKFYIKE